MDKPYDGEDFPTRTEIIKALKRMNACEDSLQFMQGMSDWQEAWDKCQMGSWMDWYLREMLRVEIASVSERAEEISKVLEIVDSIEKDAPCGCGCGLNLYFGPEAEKKLAALFRERYPVAPISPAGLALHKRFDNYFAGLFDVEEE